jgi:hypothetical protein
VAYSEPVTGGQLVWVATRRRSIMMTFYGTYVLLINVLARLFGAIAFVAGGFGLVSAYAFETDRWTHVVAGLFLIAVGAGVFIAKPVTVETIANIRRRMGRPE